MHAETLAYLLHNLPVDKKIPEIAAAGRFASGTRSAAGHDSGWSGYAGPCRAALPTNSAGTMNSSVEHVRRACFFDRRIPGDERRIPEIRASRRLPDEPLLLDAEDWAGIESENREHPHFWVPRCEFIVHRSRGAMGLSRDVRDDSAAAVVARVREPRGGLRLRALGGQETADRGAMASRRLRCAGWKRARLSVGRSVAQRRGTAISIIERWDPTPVDAHPAGQARSACYDLLGNGWEWTSTPFGPLPGFEPFPFYPGYSANFFDGKHFVMKGGSPRTDACMLRRSFRNWFQPHYPLRVRHISLRGGIAHGSAPRMACQSFRRASLLCRILPRTSCVGLTPVRDRKNFPRSISTTKSAPRSST